MKKTVLALLVVLLLGTFVACNGEVDFLLWNDSDEITVTISLGKLISLENSYYNCYFDSNLEESTKTYTIEAGTTWQDILDNNVFEFEYFYNQYGEVLIYKIDYEETFGFGTDNFYYTIYSLMKDNVPVKLTDEVEAGTYYIDLCSLPLYLESDSWSFESGGEYIYWSNALLESKDGTWEELADALSIVLYKSDGSAYTDEVTIVCKVVSDGYVYLYPDGDTTSSYYFYFSYDTTEESIDFTNTRYLNYQEVQP